MSEEKRCAQCGAVLPAESPQGLCPACLLKSGLDSGSAPGQATPPATPAELAGRFPELEILELIGRGGMGAVYKARQKNLDRLIALKVLPASVSRDPAFAERFSREAKALARLAHPNIVAVHEFGQKDGLFYFVMEFVDGLNLRQLLNTGKIAPKEALAIVPQICDALQYAHDKGIVHRDIKPENILLDKAGAVKIADFGLAKLVGVEPKDLTITDKHDVMGTPHYMAPEQVEHPQDVDHRADIYSLGVVFYQMLTGELPLGRFVPPSRKVQIDVRLDEVVLRALEKEPELRYQQASEVKTQVETIITTPASGSRGATTDRIQRLTKAPAIAVFVFGIFNWVAIPIILAILGFAITNEVRAGRPIGGGLPLLLTVPIILLVLNSLMIYGALKMKRLENFGWANAAGALCLVVGLLAMRLMFGLSLLGLPLGLWALVVLRRCEVREAFRGGRMQPTSRRVITLATVVFIALVFIGVAGFFGSLGIYHFLSTKSDYIKSDYIGQTWFPKGDLIEITSVVRTADRISVRGRYSLVSHDTALLALYITSIDRAHAIASVDPNQQMKITKGQGMFALSHPHPYAGLPHVSMYADRKPFGALYFGTKEEALEESKASWITNNSPASVQTGSRTFGPVIETLMPLYGFIDFDSGKISESGTGTNLGAMREQGFDAYTALNTFNWCDAVVTELDAEQWSQVSAVELQRLLQANGSWNKWGIASESPKTMLMFTRGFQTREGAQGILQITGYSDNPRGLKIRYKLIEDKSHPPPSISLAQHLQDSGNAFQKQVVGPVILIEGYLAEVPADFPLSVENMELNRLSRRKDIHVLYAPLVKTLSGQEASLWIGSDTPPNATNSAFALSPTGMNLHVLAEAKGDRVNFKVKVAYTDAANAQQTITRESGTNGMASFSVPVVFELSRMGNNHRLVGAVTFHLGDRSRPQIVQTSPASSSNEPSFGGKRLSVWLDELEATDYSNRADSNTPQMQAVRSIGTNAIPWLLSEMKNGSDARLRRATHGFQALGKLAEPAIPSLLKLVEVSPGYVPDALAGIGPAALPALGTCLTNTTSYGTSQGRIEPIPGNTIGAIYNALQRGNISIYDAAFLLPTIRAWARSANAHAARYAADFLRDFDLRTPNEPPAATPALQP